jgi:hypothetical protein
MTPLEKEYLNSLPSRQARYKEWRRTKRTPCPIISWCSGCKSYLPITNFTLLDPSSIHGKKTILKEKRCSLCSNCESINHKQLSDVERLLYSAKKRAKEKNIDFNLTADDIFIPEYCPALGIKLQSVQGVTGSDCSPSLDRIDNSKGYIKGNVAVISFRANTLKNSATSEELRKIANFLEEHFKNE